eukprot:403343691
MQNNFFFQKAIQTKNQIYDTMYFKDVLKNPNTPQVILFKKQEQLKPMKDFSNDLFQKMTSNPTFYQDFLNKLQPKDEFYRQKMPETHSYGNFSNTQIISPLASNRGLQQSESEMFWQDLESHQNYQSSSNNPGNKNNLHLDQQQFDNFNQQRQLSPPGRNHNTRMSHHNFQNTKSPQNLPKSNLLYNSVDLGKSIRLNQINVLSPSIRDERNKQCQGLSYANDCFLQENNKYENQKKNLQRLMENSEVLPLTQSPRKKFRLRNHHQTPLHLPKRINFLNDTQNLQFQELTSEQQKRAPPYIIQKQNLQELLQEIGDKFDKDQKTLYTIFGQRITSLVQIPPNCKVLICSPSKNFKGLQGLKNVQFQHYDNQDFSEKPHHDLSNQKNEIQNQVQSWVQTTCIQWMKKNHKFSLPKLIEIENQDISQLQQSTMTDKNMSEKKKSLNFDHYTQHLQEKQDQDQKLLESFLSQSPNKPKQSSIKIFTMLNQELTKNTGQDTVQTVAEESNFYNIYKKIGSVLHITKKQSYVMVALQELWNEIRIEEELETQLTKIICENIVKQREQQISNANKNIMKQIQIRDMEKSNKIASQYNLLKKNRNYDQRQIKTPSNVTRMNQSLIDNALEKLQNIGVVDANQNQITLKDLKTQNDVKVNKITFKNRLIFSPNNSFIVGNPSHKATGNMQYGQDKSKITDKLLTNEEVKQICEEHKITRKEVYDIRSLFLSMCLVSQNDKQQQINQAQDQLKHFIHSRKRSSTHQENSKSNSSQQIQQQQEDGITVSYFLEHCQLLTGTLLSIKQRILKAIGVDIESLNAKVNWLTFLDLYCIFESGEIEHDQMIKFWVKFFDQKLIGAVPEELYMNTLEELVRGNSFTKPNKTTKMFALMFQRMMDQAGCLGPNKEIINSKLIKAFQEDLLDIQLLSSALGNQKLDSALNKVNI